MLWLGHDHRPQWSRCFIGSSGMNLPIMQYIACQFFSKVSYQLLQQGLSIIEDNKNV